MYTNELECLNVAVELLAGQQVLTGLLLGAVICGIVLWELRRML